MPYKIFLYVKCPLESKTIYFGYKPLTGNWLTQESPTLNAWMEIAMDIYKMERYRHFLIMNQLLWKNHSPTFFSCVLVLLKGLFSDLWQTHIWSIHTVSEIHLIEMFVWCWMLIQNKLQERLFKIAVFSYHQTCLLVGRAPVDMPILIYWPASTSHDCQASVWQSKKQNGLYSFYSQWKMKYFKIGIITFIVRNVHFIFIIFVLSYYEFLLPDRYCACATLNKDEKKWDGLWNRRHDTVTK